MAQQNFFKFGHIVYCTFHLGLFRAFFGGKIRWQKLTKSKANPLKKCEFFAKNGHFLRNFFRKKKRLQMA